MDSSAEEVSIQHIPPLDPPGLSCVDFLAVRACPQQASSMISTVSNRFPLPASLSHLKRVRRPSGDDSLEILVCTVSECCLAGEDQMSEDQVASSNEQNPTGNIPPELREFLQEQGWLDAAVLRRAPQHAAPTREEWKEWCTVWPMAWKPPPPITLDATGSLTQEEKELMSRFMRTVCSTANNAGMDNAALIVHPDTHDVVALELDAQGSHPLHHAVMQALDAVANGYLAQKSAHADGPVEPQCKRIRRLDDENVAAGDACNHAQNSLCSPYEQPYLCKGYDCYVVHEPCVMCAMALTHSRVRRILFAKKDPSGGALGGAFRLHSHAALNHRLQVYHVQPPGY